MEKTSGPDREKKSKKWIWRILTALCAVILTVSAARLSATLWTAKKEDDTFKELAMYTQARPAPKSSAAPGNSAQEEAAQQETSTEDTRRENYLKLKELNPDFAGWLYIDGTKVDYPVMHTPDDQQYYIHRDFYGKDSVSGTPFMGDRCDLTSQSIIIYGHNMKNGSMFGTLDEYESRDYWEAHPTIQFHTLEEDREYDIAAVFRTRIYRDDEEGFRYYQYVGDLTEDRFEEFKDQVEAGSLYDTGVFLEPGDEILILSTCAYHVRDGRFVVVGRRRT